MSTKRTVQCDACKVTGEESLKGGLMVTLETRMPRRRRSELIRMRQRGKRRYESPEVELYLDLCKACAEKPITVAELAKLAPKDPYEES